MLVFVLLLSSDAGFGESSRPARRFMTSRVVSRIADGSTSSSGSSGGVFSNTGPSVVETNGVSASIGLENSLVLVSSGVLTSTAGGVASGPVFQYCWLEYQGMNARELLRLLLLSLLMPLRVLDFRLLLLLSLLLSLTLLMPLRALDFRLLLLLL